MATLRNYSFLPAPAGSGSRYSPTAPGGAFTYDALKRMYVVPQTGLPYTGALGATGNFAIGGKWSATPPPGTNPDLPQFDVTHTVRQPAIAALTDTLTKQAQAQATATGTDLAKTLPGLEDIATSSYTRSQAATDTGPLEAQLAGSLTAQEKAQRDLVEQQGQRNQDLTASTNANLAALAKINTDRKANILARGERAGAAAITNANLIPQNRTTRSGAQPSRVAVALANALLPYQMEADNIDYNTITNYQQPWQRDLYNQDTALNAFKSALEVSLGNDWRSNFRFVQQLKQETAQMDAVSKERYINQRLTLARFPSELLNGQISMAALLQRLDDAATEHLVSQPIDTSQFVGGPSFSPPSVGRSYRPTQPNPQVMEGGGDWRRANEGGGYQPGWGGGRYVPPTEQQRWLAYAQSPQYRPTAPIDPWRDSTGSGWGYVNGQYIGADADAWNDEVYGPVFSG